MTPRQHPVENLREQATTLEAALTLVLASPTRQAVHRVRISTRRIEAQLELLAALPCKDNDLRAVPLERTRKLRKLLTAVRKAAGSVRDLDVQRDLIKQAGSKEAAKSLRKQAKDLREHLKAQRHHRAQALLDQLEGHSRKLGPRLEDLLEELQPLADEAWSAERLSQVIRDWYATRTAGSNATTDALHGIRKTAKLARYMAHSIGDQPLARYFEDIQQSGGTWHDALTLSHVAREHLGKKAALAQAFARQEGSALAAYRERLDADPVTARPAG